MGDQRAGCDRSDRKDSKRVEKTHKDTYTTSLHRES